MKNRTEPLLLEGLRAAIQRLPWEDKNLQQKYASVKAGFGGEQQLDRVFERYKFPMEYRVFNDLSLKSNTYFQIDTLFITPSYAILFEVKNIAGEMKVLANPPQLQRTLENGEIHGFKSPITQVQNNCQLLEDWFHSRKIALPVYGAVVLAYSKQRIELLDTSIPFLFPEGVPMYIRNLPVTPQLLGENEFEEVAGELLACHQEYIPQPICEMFPNLYPDIKTGVFCPACHLFPMEKYTKGWRCLSCRKTSADAHQQAIREWFLLFGGEMKNKDCRAFLNVKCRQMAYRLLQSMELEVRGANRNRSYRLELRQRDFISR